MPDITDFLPVVSENIVTIRARVDADANAGLDPSDPRFIDTTPGGFYFDLTQPVLLEIERLWDMLSTEMVAATFPSYAWGEYLDDHGAILNVGRKAAAKASGLLSFFGANGTLISTGTQVGTIRTSPDADPISFVTTMPATIPVAGVIEVTAESDVAGDAGNVSAGQATVLLTPIAGVTSVSNPSAMSGGADVESDQAYSDRLALEYASAEGAGTISDYVRWALSYPGVGHVTVEPLWNGPGTVRVVISDTANNPVSSITISGLQALLDPVAGKGEGLAPIGAIVTVATSTTLIVNVVGTVVFETGYSLTGASGTIAVLADLRRAIEDYVNDLNPGEDVILERLKSRFFTVPGVRDVAGLQLNGAVANVAVSALQVPQVGTITLT